MKYTHAIVMVGFIICNCAYAQQPLSNLYQYNYTMISPTFAGLDGQKVTMMGNYYRAGDGSFSSGFAAYEVNAKKINSGFALTASQASLGPQSTSYINLLYNYQFQVGEKSKVVVGAKVSDVINMVDFSLYLPIDPNDPLLDDQNRSLNTLLIDFGILFKREKFFAGISTDNLIHKVLNADQYLNADAYEERGINYTAGVDWKIANWLSSTHSVYAFTLDQYWRVDLNTTFTFGGWIMAGVSIQKNKPDDDIIPKVNAGIKLKQRGQINLMLYSKDYDFPSKDFSAQLAIQFRLD